LQELIKLFSDLRVVNFDDATTSFDGIDARITAALIVIAACAVVSERLRRATSAQTSIQPSLEPQEGRLIGGIAAAAASATLSTLLYLELRTEWLIVGWAAMLLLQLGGTLLRDGIRVRTQALLLCAMVAARAFAINMESIDWRRLPLWIALTLLFAAVPFGFHLRKQLLPSSEKGNPLLPLVQHLEQSLFFIPLLVLCVLLGVEFSNGTLTLAWCSLGVAVFLYFWGAFASFVTFPDPLVSQFLPRCYQAVRERAIAPRPLPLVLEAIRQAFLPYLKATGADLSQSTRGE